MSSHAPLVRTYSVPLAAVAQGASATAPALRVPFAGTITAVAVVASAAITGAATNTRKLALVNKGQSGSGSTEVAAIQFNGGINAAAFDDTALTLSGTTANRSVAEGDVLALASTAVGTGIADPGGLLLVTVSRV